MAKPAYEAAPNITGTILESAPTGSLGWVTACLSYDAQVPEGTYAFYVKGMQGDAVVLSPVVDGIPAETGFIFNATDGVYAFEPALSVATDDNVLSAAISDVTVEPRTTFTLAAVDDNSVGFRLYAGTEIPAGRAYLQKALLGDTEAKALTMKLDEPTAISSMAAAVAKSTAVYDLEGRRVTRPVAGHVYVIGGRKVIFCK